MTETRNEPTSEALEGIYRRRMDSREEGKSADTVYREAITELTGKAGRSLLEVYREALERLGKDAVVVGNPLNGGLRVSSLADEVARMEEDGDGRDSFGPGWEPSRHYALLDNPHGGFILGYFHSADGMNPHLAGAWERPKRARFYSPEDARRNGVRVG